MVLGQSNPMPVTIRHLMSGALGKINDHKLGRISRVILATLYYVSIGSTLQYFNNLMQSFKSVGAAQWLAMQLEHQENPNILSVGMTDKKGKVQYIGAASTDFTFKPLLITRKYRYRSIITVTLMR